MTGTAGFSKRESVEAGAWAQSQVIITIVAIIIDTITIAFYSPGHLRWQTFPIFI